MGHEEVVGSELFCSHIKIILPSKFTIPRKSSFTGGEVLPQSKTLGARAVRIQKRLGI